MENLAKEKGGKLKLGGKLGGKPFKKLEIQELFKRALKIKAFLNRCSLYI